MTTFSIAGIGEILWDILNDSEELGGAPLNFAYHTGELGALNYVISTIGDDKRGRAALTTLKKHKLSCDHITVRPNSVTGYVMANVDQKGVATYDFPDNVAWDNIYLSQATEQLATKLDAVCFGSLAQRSEASRATIRNFLASTSKKTLKVFDVNLRQQFYTSRVLEESLEIADIVKLNEDEIQILAKMNDLTGDELSVLKKIRNKYRLKLAVLTLGEKGSLLLSRSEVSEYKALPAKIVDTIGAGDAFTAVTVLGFLQGLPLNTINEHANRVAAFVCSNKGAMVALPKDLHL